jgi:hypothetical protein
MNIFTGSISPLWTYSPEVSHRNEHIHRKYLTVMNIFTGSISPFRVNMFIMLRYFRWICSLRWDTSGEYVHYSEILLVNTFIMVIYFRWICALRCDTSDEYVHYDEILPVNMLITVGYFRWICSPEVSHHNEHIHQKYLTIMKIFIGSISP